MAILKQNKKFEHLYAILRFETDADAQTPIDLRVTVKKVVTDPGFAAQEVQRLNELNRDKGAYYFSQITRFEDVPIEIAAVSSTMEERSQADVNGV